MAIESDIPANKDVIKNGTYGTLFKSESLEDFQEKLQWCLSNENHMKEVSEKAQEYAAKQLMWPKTLIPVVEWVNGQKEKIQ